MAVNLSLRYTDADPAKLYRYGDQYKLQIRKNPVNLLHKRNSEDDFSPSENTEKLEQSFSRARARVMELGLCNDWDYFVTLTLDREKYDRYALPVWQRDLSQWIRNQRRLHGGPLRYLLIPEQHEDGAWHMHGLVTGIDVESLELNNYGYLDWPAYRRKFGFISLSKIKNRVACGRYISKYVSKDLGARAADIGAHLYYASHGLKGKELVDQGFFAPPEGLQPTVDTDYWWIFWLDSPIGLNHD